MMGWVTLPKLKLWTLFCNTLKTVWKFLLGHIVCVVCCNGWYIVNWFCFATYFRYVCEFTYFTSLNIDNSRTAFIHVPVLNKPYSAVDLAEGIKAILRVLIEKLRTQQQDKCLNNELCSVKSVWFWHPLFLRIEIVKDSNTLLLFNFGKGWIMWIFNGSYFSLFAVNSAHVRWK